MEQLQKLVNDMIKEIPKLALEKRLAQKLEEVSIKVDEETISKAAQHVLSGNPDIFHLSGHEDVTNPTRKYVTLFASRSIPYFGRLEEGAHLGWLTL